MGTDILAEFLPKQKLLFDSIVHGKAPWIGYGGARGGAKSFAVREIAMWLAQSPLHQYSAMIFRKHAKELHHNHILPLLSRSPGLRKHFNKTEKILYSEDKRPLITFGYAASDLDVHKFQGMEFDLVFVDEATQSSEYLLKFLKTVNRSTVPGWIPKIVLTMNPGGIGHAFIKRIFIDRHYKENEVASDYSFIQSYLWDNVYWVAEALLRDGISQETYYSWTDQQRKEYCLRYSEYAKNLSSLPHDLREAYLSGDWEIFGGMFFKNFSSKRNVIKPFVIPDDWELIGSLDPGFSSPCSFGITACSKMGVVFRVCTYYERELPASVHAETISRMLKHEGSEVRKLLNGRIPSLIVAGRDAFARKEMYGAIPNEHTYADPFLKEGFRLESANTERVAGWWKWKSLLPDRYFIFDKFNQPLIQEMMGATSDPRRPEDLAGGGNDPKVSDHALDEQRYGIMGLQMKQQRINPETLVSAPAYLRL